MTGNIRTAQVGRDPDGNPLGAAVFLEPAELVALGIDIDAVDRVAYRVNDGELRITEPEVVTP